VVERAKGVPPGEWIQWAETAKKNRAKGKKKLDKGHKLAKIAWMSHDGARNLMAHDGLFSVPASLDDRLAVQRGFFLRSLPT
jgi:hypothetical protein